MPQPTPDTLYFVFVPGSVKLKDSSGADSDGNFDAYHDYARADGFAYAIVLANDPQQTTNVRQPRAGRGDHRPPGGPVGDAWMV